MAIDFIMNGQAGGAVATRLLQANLDHNVLRPYFGDDGNQYVTVWNNQTKKFEAVMQQNANATLRYEDWKHLDKAVIKVAKPRLKAAADLQSAGLTYNVPGGMGTTVLMHETQSDITEADVSLDGMSESEDDRPVWQLNNLPLPIIHKGFGFSLRQIQASRNGGSPLDTTTAELAGRRVAEEVEKFVIGTRAAYTYGGGTIYGYTNYPSRMTRTIVDPTSTGWTPQDTVDDVLAMQQQSVDAFHYGDWKLYYSTKWNRFMGNDYSAAKGDNTLLDRLATIPSITGVQSLDYLTSYQLLLVQMSSDIVRLVNGLPMTTLQWETHGGMYVKFKVMTIMVPQLRSDQNGNTGIVHGSI